jgi:hypothetical protein
MSHTWLRKFGGFFVSWLVVLYVIQFAMSIYTHTLYFLTSYIGFLFATEFSDPRGQRPKTHKRLRWVSLAGFGGFLYVVVTWVQMVISTGTT